MLKKMDKKGFAFIPVLIAVLLVSTVAVFATPLGQVLGIGTAEHCSDTPFDDDCYCNDIEDRIDVTTTFVDRFYCENSDKLVYVDGETFEDDALAYAVEKWTEYFPTCDMIGCNRENTDYEIVWGYRDYEATSVQVECVSGGGEIFSKANFNAVDGTIYDIACADYDEVIEETTSTDNAQFNVELNNDGESSGTAWWTARLTSRCGMDDNGFAVYKLESPIGADIVSWKMGNPGTNELFDEMEVINGLCRFEDVTSTSAMLVCDTGCPHADFSDYPIQVYGEYNSDYLSQIYCSYDYDNDGNVNYYEVGTRQCCQGPVLGDGHMHECGEDLTWTVDEDSQCSTTRQEFCPGYQ